MGVVSPNLSFLWEGRPRSHGPRYGPRVSPPCQGPGWKHLLAWLVGLGPPGGTAQRLHLLSWKLCMGGEGTAAFERDPWIFWPFSVSPPVNVCALAQVPACTGTAWCGMGPRKQTLFPLPSWPSEPGSSGRGLAACGTPCFCLLVTPPEACCCCWGRLPGWGWPAYARGREGDTAAVFLRGQSLY